MTALAAFGTPRAVEIDKEDRVFLGPYLEYLEDSGRQWSIDQVSSPEFSPLFKALPNDTATMGTLKSTYWFRFTVEPAHHHETGWQNWNLEVGYPSLEQVELYVPGKKKGEWQVKKAGELIPFDQREIWHRNIIFRFTLPHKKPVTCYMRVDVEKVMIFPLFLWSQEAFGRKTYIEQYVHGLYFGIMFVMIFYNLFLLLSLKDKSYLYYIIYILSSTFFQIAYTGFGFDFLWSASPEWNSRANIFFVFLAGFWALKFCSSYLETDKNTPRLHMAFNVLMIISGISMGLTFLLDRTPATILSNIVPFLAVALVIPTGIICLRQGYRPARYYLIAWGVFLVGVILFIMKNLKVLPGNIITIYGAQFGSALEVVFFSLGLADRINILNEEREKVRSQLIEVQKELDIAKRIQLSILPSHIPYVKGLKIVAHYVPAHSVGGDYYDYHVLGKNRIGLIIADASGHGLPAALIASMAKVAFSQQMAGGEEPARVISGLNDTLIGKLGRQFITASYACFDMERRQLKNANAGHLPMILIKRNGGEIAEYNPSGVALGISPNKIYRDLELTLEEGDRVIFYTDGVIESRNAAGELYGEERFFAFIRQFLHHEPEVLIRNLMERLTHWSGREETFEDDLTVIIVDVTE